MRHRHTGHGDSVSPIGAFGLGAGRPDVCVRTPMPAVEPHTITGTSCDGTVVASQPPLAVRLSTARDAQPPDEPPAQNRGSASRGCCELTTDASQCPPGATAAAGVRRELGMEGMTCAIISGSGSPPIRRAHRPGIDVSIGGGPTGLPLGPPRQVCIRRPTRRIAPRRLAGNGCTPCGIQSLTPGSRPAAMAPGAAVRIPAASPPLRPGAQAQPAPR